MFWWSRNKKMNKIKIDNWYWVILEDEQEFEYGSCYNFNLGYNSYNYWYCSRLFWWSWCSCSIFQNKNNCFMNDEPEPMSTWETERYPITQIKPQQSLLDFWKRKGIYYHTTYIEFISPIQQTGFKRLKKRTRTRWIFNSGTYYKNNQHSYSCWKCYVCPSNIANLKDLHFSFIEK